MWVISRIFGPSVASRVKKLWQVSHKTAQIFKNFCIFIDTYSIQKSSICLSLTLNYNCYIQMNSITQNQDFLIGNHQQLKVESIKSRRLLKSIKERQSSFKFYNWDILENYTYITYLTNFRYIFDSQAERKRVKVFRHLSKLIKTRNPHQIKSHHQKMMLRHVNVDSIIEYLRIKITKQLNLTPELIPVIEKINKEAQDFFISETNLHNSIKFNNLQPRLQTRQTKQGVAQDTQGYQVKVEEAHPYYLYSEVKHQQNIIAPSDFTCLKEEDNDDMIVRIYK